MIITEKHVITHYELVARAQIFIMDVDFDPLFPKNGPLNGLFQSSW